MMPPISFHTTPFRVGLAIYSYGVIITIFGKSRVLGKGLR